VPDSRRSSTSNCRMDADNTEADEGGEGERGQQRRDLTWSCGGLLDDAGSNALPRTRRRSHSQPPSSPGYSPSLQPSGGAERTVEARQTT
jgi:hypothetical protein